MRFRHVASSCLLLSDLAAVSAATRDTSLVQILETLDVNSTTCEGTSKECRTATQAAPLLEKSFSRFNITCRQEAACIVPLTVLESVGFKFMRNVSPGRPGQGTVNMQMCNFNLLYAQSIPELRDRFSAVQEVNCPEKECKDAKICNEILGNVTSTDELAFSSAAWFYATQCKNETIKRKLRDNAAEGCDLYLKECVGVDPKNQDRLNLNQRAFDLFGVTNSSKCVPLPSKG